MVPRLRRRRLSVSSFAFAGRARRFRRARDPGTTVARSVSGRVRRRNVAREYGARTAKESLPLTLIGSGNAGWRDAVSQFIGMGAIIEDVAAQTWGTGIEAGRIRN